MMTNKISFLKGREKKIFQICARVFRKCDYNLSGKIKTEIRKTAG